MTHESSLRRARFRFTGSTLLFGAGRWSSWTSPAVSEILRVGGFLPGIFAWSLLCTAYDSRHKAL